MILSRGRHRAGAGAVGLKLLHKVKRGARASSTSSSPARSSERSRFCHLARKRRHRRREGHPGIRLALPLDLRDGSRRRLCRRRRGLAARRAPGHRFRRPRHGLVGLHRRRLALCREPRTRNLALGRAGLAVAAARAGGRGCQDRWHHRLAHYALPGSLASFGARRRTEEIIPPLAAKSE